MNIKLVNVGDTLALEFVEETDEDAVLLRTIIVPLPTGQLITSRTCRIVRTWQNGQQPGGGPVQILLDGAQEETEKRASTIGRTSAAASSASPVSDGAVRVKRPVPPTERELRRVICPVGANCALCGLDPEDDSRGVAQMAVMYGGRTYGDEGNELVALWRRPYLCIPCILKIKEYPAF